LNQQAERKFSVEVDGLIYLGSYTHQGGVLTVQGVDADLTFPSKTTMHKGPADAMARTLLREMVAEGLLVPERKEDGQR
jgi:hypothetical protein